MKCTILEFNNIDSTYLISYRSKKRTYNYDKNVYMIRLCGVKIIKSKNVNATNIRKIKKEYGSRAVPKRRLFSGITVDVPETQNLVNYNDVESALLVYEVF